METAHLMETEEEENVSEAGSDERYDNLLNAYKIKLI